MYISNPDNWPRRRLLKLRPEEQALLSLAGIVATPHAINGVWYLYVRKHIYLQMPTPPFPNLEEFQAVCAELMRIKHAR